MKMKILIISNEPNSTYVLRKEVIKKIVENGYDVYLTMPYGDRVENFKDIGVNFIESKLNRRGTNPYSDYKLYRQYKKIIKFVRPDVILTYTIKPNIYGGLAAAKYNMPYIANITGLGSALENKSLIQKLLIVMYKRAFRKINTVFFQNEENRQFFIDRKIALGKHDLLPGSGVNLEKFKEVPYPDKEKIRFIFIARIMKEKGIDYYLNATTHFMSKYDNLEFHILGAYEEDYKEILLRYEKENKIIYHGAVRDVREYLKDIHAIIHPTYYPEGMSNVLLEAAAIGRPGITSNRSGCREIINHGKTGFIFENQNQEDLFEQIEKFIVLPYEEKALMGLEARKKVEQEFDRNIVVRKYLEKIKELK